MEDWKKNGKEGFLIALATAIKKDNTTSIRKQANELKVSPLETVWTVIKQDLCSNLNLFDYAIWGVLKNMQLPI